MTKHSRRLLLPLAVLCLAARPGPPPRPSGDDGPFGETPGRPPPPKVTPAGKLQSSAPAADAPVEARLASAHGLDTVLLYDASGKGEAYRQRAFLELPLTFFAYATGEDTASPLPVHRGITTLARERPPLLAGEPVLILDGAAGSLRVLTADGALFRVRSPLAAAPPKAVQLPARASPFLFTTQLPEPDDTYPEFDSVRAAEAKFNGCMTAELARTDPSGAASRYDLVTRRGGELVSIENFGTHLEQKAARKCGGKAVEAARKKAFGLVIKAYDAGRVAFLKAVKARFEKELGAR